jgi:hypothetical protein
MKLGQLNAAIDAAPNVFVGFTWGAVAVQKGSLKAALKDHHHGQRSAETGLCLNGNHFLQWERSPLGL